MRITQLNSQNVKRLQAVSITPEGSIVRITGRNAQGKSSVLDSILYVFGGKDEICAKPVRNGQKRAEIVCKLDDGLIVKRTFTAEGGTTLSVMNGEGAKYPTPQAMLDKLYGKLTLDPLAFSRQPAKQQLETLKSLVGLDFSAMDRERAAAYADRTAVNGLAKAIEAQAAAFSQHAGVPAEEVSAAEIIAQINEGQRANDSIRKREAEVNSIKADIGMGERELAELLSRVERVQASIKSRTLALEAAQSAVATMTPVDLMPLQEQLQGAEAVNRNVRENRRRAELDAQAEGHRQKSQELTDRIDAIDEQKREQLAAAAFPVPDLSFDESGVLLKGVPFDQASAAEKLRASVAIGLAMNPKLRVLLIRDGSLLDAEGLRILSEMAEERDAQIWIERVEDASLSAVHIEDGMVREEGPEAPIASGTLIASVTG